MKYAWVFPLLILVSACSTGLSEDKNRSTKEPIARSDYAPLQLTLGQAQEIVHLPLNCIDTEYPNKLNQVIGSNRDLLPPTKLHPAFYGCFDWHSAVHGHWSLVRLLRTFPNLEQKDEIIRGLQKHINSRTIEGELAYFDNELSQGFERMYGWAWLLKLAEELHQWDIDEARALENDLQPLTELIVSQIETFLPKLKYPIRVGTHTNTAFALGMIYDFANTTGNAALKELVEGRAREYYSNDRNCPLGWEPSGYDFLSPCLEEADLMRRVLPKKEFESWLSEFLPQLSDEGFTLKPGIVTDREDGHLVHLDGLNYSRAWCLYGIAETLPKYSHLKAIANEHIEHSLGDLTDGNYEGGHWLASFALMALTR